MRNWIKLFGLGLVGILLAPAPGVAHEQAIGFTEVRLVTGETGDCAVEDCRVEVAHRLSIHDAETTLMNVLGARADLVGDVSAQARFESYVEQKFMLSDADTGATVPLVLLGGETERGYYWVYQEAQIDAAPTSLTITHGVLMDAIEAQTNRVNILSDGTIGTLVFSRDPGPQTYTFDQVTSG